MILFASGRTDIVAKYSKWFLKRYKEGFVDTRNPFNPKLVSRIYFEDVDAIVFCTKNPIPILNDLRKIQKPIIFQITLTPYQQDIEPGVMNKRDIIEAIQKLSKIIPKENIFLRYDPIFVNEKYTLEYHCKAFDRMCNLLNGYVKHVIISFLDDYKNVRKNAQVLHSQVLKNDDYEFLGKSFFQSANKNDMSIQTCYEEQDLVMYGFIKDVCVSKKLIFDLVGKEYKTWKARDCGCVELVDIGSYNTCQHFCKYCYANYDECKVSQNAKKHDEDSSLLIGNIQADDKVVRRK